MWRPGGLGQCAHPAHVGHTPLLRVVDDQDDILWLPSPSLTEPDEPFAIGAPTFSRAGTALEAHHRNFGPGILVLDAIEWARPYAGIDEYPAEASTLVHEYFTHAYLTALTPSQVRNWRTNDLRRLTRRSAGTRTSLLPTTTRRRHAWRPPPFPSHDTARLLTGRFDDGETGP